MSLERHPRVVLLCGRPGSRMREETENPWGPWDDRRAPAPAPSTAARPTRHGADTVQRLLEQTAS